MLIDNDLRHIEAANRVGINTILFGSFNPDYSGYQASNWDEVSSIIEKIIEDKK